MLALNDLLAEAKIAIQAALDLTTLDQIRVTFLGKKGKLTEELKKLGTLPPAERPLAGQQVNVVKAEIETAIAERLAVLEKSALAERFAREVIDVTLPGRQSSIGSIHPISLVMEELRAIFAQMGFTFLEGPEIEDDYHNFAALNIPPNHPARAMQDTFYFGDGRLLRAHMSTVEVHGMKKLPVPFRFNAMGKVYRRDFDVTHTPMFHQMECLVIDEGLSFADLKGLLQHFLRQFFGSDIKMRLRPSYFPFTEPSAEVDIGCMQCHGEPGENCRICKGTGYLEILGCGMTHPNVLQMAGIDHERYRGFAFGMGIDRLALLKYGISDLRLLFENDVRFLQQF